MYSRAHRHCGWNALLNDDAIFWKKKVWRHMEIWEQLTCFEWDTVGDVLDLNEPLETNTHILVM